MIIDFHTHCFPDALAPRAMSKLTATASAIEVFATTDGTAHGLLANMKHAGINRAVVCNIATNAHQMNKVNDFAISLLDHAPALIPLGSLHPHGDDLEGELDRLVVAGIKGIKLHPDYVGIHIDDPAFEPIFGLCQSKNVFVVTHAGFDPVSPEHLFCPPERLIHVLDNFPSLKLVAAHMGGFHCEEGVLSLLCGRNVYMDTSLFTTRPDRYNDLRRIVLSHDPDKLLFATDTPWADASAEIACIRTMELGTEFEEKILSTNALSLLSSVGYRGYDA